MAMTEQERNERNERIRREERERLSDDLRAAHERSRERQAEARRTRLHTFGLAGGRRSR